MGYRLSLNHPDGSKLSEGFELNAGDTFAVKGVEYTIFTKDGLFKHAKTTDYKAMQRPIAEIKAEPIVKEVIPALPEAEPVIV